MSSPPTDASRRPRAARRLLLALAPVLGGHGVMRRAWRTWEAVLTARGKRCEQPVTDCALALPPIALRVRVIADADADVFLASGKAEAAILADAFAAHGVAIEQAGRLLDFGCGCGRLLRHWSTYAPVEIHGTDHDADLTAWVARGLPFVHVKQNQLTPPLPYPDDHFGAIYAISVFTHMTSDLARAWMAELHRILRPGGLLLMTALDDRQAERLRPRERAAYERGEAVVQFEDALGTNMCVSYHPRAFIEAISRGFTLLSTRPIGAQALYALRSEPSSPRAI